jgi:serine/threonine protein kinase
MVLDNREVVVDGYRTVERLFVSSVSEVWLLKDISTNEDVIAKISERKRLEKELGVLQQLQGCPGVLTVHGLRKTKDHRTALFLPNGGMTLDSYLNRKPIELREFLKFGIQIMHSLGHIHAKGILHGDLKPQNILIERTTRSIHIVDFSVSLTLNPETNFVFCKELIGTPEFGAPERSGMTGLPIDLRSDLYSIGVCFYVMMSGRLPFNYCKNSVLDLVHPHLSLRPPLVSQFNSQIPPIIERLIHTLLEKDPKDRFQSSFGVEETLRTIQQELEFTSIRREIISSEIDKNRDGGISFESENVSVNVKNLKLNELLRQKTQLFHIDGLIVGRATVMKEIEIWLDNARILKSNQILIIKGEPGIGKTSVIKELISSQQHKQTIILKGKCEEEAGPRSGFGPVRKIFQILFHLVVSFGVNVCSQVENILANELKGRERALVGICDEWSRFLKSQPPLPSLPTPDEDIARINTTLGDCLSCVMNVVSSLQHLCIIFDDCQWLDVASVSFVEYLLTTSKPKCSIICTSRPITFPSPFESFLSKEYLADFTHFSLTTLSPSDIITLLKEGTSNGFHAEDRMSKIPQLANAIYNKTNGNPFFVKQIIHSLLRDQIIRFDADTGEWRCLSVAIRGLANTYEIISFLVQKVSQLNEDVRSVFASAACIGSTFSEKLIMALCKPHVDVSSCLVQLQSYGLVELTSKETFEFTHDSIRQVGLSLLTEHEKMQTHLQIAYCLAPESSRNEHILLQHAAHFSIGWSYIQSQSERANALITILKASDIAIRNTTFDIGYSLLVQSRLLYDCLVKSSDGEEIPSINKRDLFVSMMSNYVLCAWRTTHFEEALYVLTNEILTYSKLTKAERIEFLRSKSLLQSQCGDYVDAQSPAIEALRLLNQPIELSYDMRYVGEEVGRVGGLIASNGGIQMLKTLPECKITEYNIINDILLDLVPGSFVLKNFPLYCMLGVLSVLNSLHHGLVRSSAEGFGFFGCVSAFFFGQKKLGGEMAKLCEELVSSGKVSSNHISRSLIHAGLGGQWMVRHQEVASWLERAIQPGILCGDFLHSSGASAFYVEYGMISGLPLTSLQRFIKKLKPLIRSSKQVDIEFIFHSFHLWIEWMTGKRESIPSLTETDLQRPPFAISVHFVFGCLALLLAGDFKNALEFVISCERNKCVQASNGMGRYFEFVFLSTMVYIFSVKLGLIEMKEIANNISESIQLLRDWNDVAPFNWGARYSLANSFWEIVRTSKEGGPLTHKSLQKIEGSVRETDCVWVRALGLAAASHASELLDLDIASRCYRLEGLRILRDWGAFSGTYSTPSIQKASHSSESNVEAVALIKSAQLLSTEETKDSLFKECLQLIMSAFGATRVVLALYDKSDNNGETLQVVGSLSTSQLDLKNYPLDQKVPMSLVQFVIISQHTACIDDVSLSRFSTDLYFIENNVKSVLCDLIVLKGQKKGLIYLENDTMTDAFDSARTLSLKIVTTQMILSADNLFAFECLKQKNLELQQLDSFKHDILARISHELRTPLHGIIGIASHSTVERRAVTELVNDFAIITKCGEQLLLLINDLLDFSRLRSKKMDLNLQVSELLS